MSSPIASLEEAVELLEALVDVGRKLVDSRVEPLGQSAALRREHAVHGFEALPDLRDERLRGFGEALRFGGDLLEQRAALLAQRRADRPEAFLEEASDVLRVTLERGRRLLNVLIERLRVRLERLRMLDDTLGDAVAAVRQRLFEIFQMRFDIFGDGVAALRERFGGFLAAALHGGFEGCEPLEQILGDALALHRDRHDRFSGRGGEAILQRGGMRRERRGRLLHRALQGDAQRLGLRGGVGLRLLPLRVEQRNELLMRGAEHAAMRREGLVQGGGQRRVTRLELLDERRARRPQLAINVGHAIRKALAHLAGHAFDGLRETRADLVDLLDEALVTRAEILDQRRARRLQLVVDLARRHWRNARPPRASLRRATG